MEYFRLRRYFQKCSVLHGLRSCGYARHQTDTTANSPPPICKIPHSPAVCRLLLRRELIQFRTTGVSRKSSVFPFYWGMDPASALNTFYSPSSTSLHLSTYIQSRVESNKNPRTIDCFITSFVLVWWNSSQLYHANSSQHETVSRRRSDDKRRDEPLSTAFLFWSFNDCRFREMFVWRIGVEYEYEAKRNRCRTFILLLFFICMRHLK